MDWTLGEPLKDVHLIRRVWNVRGFRSAISPCPRRSAARCRSGAGRFKPHARLWRVGNPCGGGSHRVGRVRGRSCMASRPQMRNRSAKSSRTLRVRADRGSACRPPWDPNRLHALSDSSRTRPRPRSIRRNCSGERRGQSKVPLTQSRACSHGPEGRILQLGEG